MAKLTMSSVCPFCVAGVSVGECECEWAERARGIGLVGAGREYEEEGNVYPSTPRKRVVGGPSQLVFPGGDKKAVIEQLRGVVGDTVQTDRTVPSTVHKESTVQELDNRPIGTVPGTVRGRGIGYAPANQCDWCDRRRLAEAERVARYRTGKKGVE